MRFHELPQPDYRNTLNFSSASNSDIITVIDKNFPTAVEQTKNFAKRFKGNNNRETAHKIWKFLRQHITYQKDDDSGQLVRLPSRFIADQTGDCKSYSLTAASILTNLGLPTAFRYASYTASVIPSHVYVVTKDESGNDIIIDGVYSYFDSEKNPTYKFDKEKKMDVRTLSGLQDALNGELSGIGKHKGKGKFAHNIKKFSLAPMRQAFLSLVMVNLFGLARKFARSIARDPKAVEKKWYQLGGKYSTLKKFVNIGLKFVPKKKRPKKVSGLAGLGDIHGIGNPAAFLAAAAPILIAIAPLLKKKGEAPLPGETPLPTEEAGAPSSTMDKILDVATGAAERLGNGSQAVDPTDPEHAEKFDKQEGANDQPGGFSIKPIYLALGAGALFLLMKKK